MKITVISDTHRDSAALYDIMAKNADSELFIHLGDGENELYDMQSAFYDKAIIGVKGNCDCMDTLPQYRRLTLEGHTLYICHGHAFPPDTFYDSLYATGAANGCDIVLFGHTHVPHCETRDGVLLFNPGSPSRPRGGSAPSYGILELSAGRPVSARHITLKG